MAVEKGRGKRYPEALRARVVSWALRRRNDGAGWEEIKRELAQQHDTVRRWCLSAPALTSRELIPVKIVDAATPARVVSVISPSGFRVDGLSIGEAAAMLREIG
jgi:hypothetical protein